MSLKLAILTFLYFIQGLPYGFQDKVIPLYLRDKGLNYTQLSLTKLLLIPWFCKALFAPLIDKFYTHSLWLKFSLYSLSITALLTAWFLTETFVGLAISLFTLNIFTAIQDISVDALALNTLQEHEVGKGNTAQVVGYKLGAVFGGGFLFWIQSRYGLDGLFLTLAVVYIGAALIYKLVDPTVKKPGEPRTPVTPSSDRSLLTVSDYFSGFLTNETTSIVFFILTYKLGESGCLSTFPIYLVDQEVGKESVVFWNNVIGQICSLLGSAYGGILLKDTGKTVGTLKKACLVRIIPVTFAWILVNCWELTDNYILTSILTVLSILSLIALQFTGGIISTATFSIMMICSQAQKKTIKATHYSTLASVEVFGKLIFASFIGTALDAYGFPHVYFVLVLLTLVPYFIVPNNLQASSLEKDE